MAAAVRQEASPSLFVNTVIGSFREHAAQRNDSRIGARDHAQVNGRKNRGARREVSPASQDEQQPDENRPPQ
jgi:hypothetical protein